VTNDSREIVEQGTKVIHDVSLSLTNFISGKISLYLQLTLEINACNMAG